ncbi:serine/threonine protein kinase [Candidatus Margulisiibacteriota bacterium]
MERFLKSRYKIGDKISENPFSVTYRGSMLENGRPVVIKIYKRGTLNSKLINRMKQKVKELSLIKHHGIARLIDGDYGWQGFYYVREYVEGQSLEQLLASKDGVGEERARAIAEEVCRALESAHAKGIVHGALKPSNVFVDKKGLVKVADFVIEGQIKEAMPQKVVSIMDDGRHLSPEELGGQAASASSDIYALGALLGEMLLPQAPLSKKGLAGGLKKMKQNPLLEDELLARVPRYLQDIIGKALQADPQLRFASATSFRESLENKNLVEMTAAHEEYVKIFENTVTQFGGEDISRESESLRDLGRVRLRWGKEKHRNWILAFILGVALISGMVYAFMFGR